MVSMSPGLESMQARSEAQPHVSAVPERIPKHRRALMAGADAAVVLFVSILSLNGGSGSRVAAAIVTAALICGVFWLCGYYRRSYAVYARDEVYYACAGVALAAVPVVILLSSVDDLPLGPIVLSLALSALATSVLHIRLHISRRPAGPPPYAGISSVSPGAWHDREQVGFEASKRLFDTAVALLALALFSPVMLAAAIAIALESRGPVLFRQERVGRDGKRFDIMKFRTMRPDAGSDWVKPGDSRITRVGAWLRRTSLDELPQLFNVLRGEMSVVGPRPEMVSFAQGFAGELPAYVQRHIVAPGITGWAQVYLKRNLQPDEVAGVLPYDLFYVEHASVLLDTAIILKTAVEVLFHRAV